MATDPATGSVGFAVSPHLLHVHAETVRAIVANLNASADTGAAVALRHGAFGLLFAPLAKRMERTQLAVVVTLRRDAAKLAHVSDVLDEVADEYESTDATAAGEYQGVGA